MKLCEAMPPSVIKSKQRYAAMTTTELKAHIEKLAKEKGRTPVEQAQVLQRLHVISNNRYVNAVNS